MSVSCVVIRRRGATSKSTLEYLSETRLEDEETEECAASHLSAPYSAGPHYEIEAAEGRRREREELVGVWQRQASTELRWRCRGVSRSWRTCHRHTRDSLYRMFKVMMDKRVI